MELRYRDYAIKNAFMTDITYNVSGEIVNLHEQAEERHTRVEELYQKPWLVDSVDFYLCQKSNFAHKIQELMTK